MLLAISGVSRSFKSIAMRTEQFRRSVSSCLLEAQGSALTTSTYQASFTRVWSGDTFGVTLYEWTASSDGRLTVIVARCERRVKEVFKSFVGDHIELAVHPLCFDFIECHAHLRACNISAGECDWNKVAGLMQPRSHDAIDEVQAYIQGLLLNELHLGYITPCLNQMEQCEKLLLETEQRTWHDVIDKFHAITDVSIFQLREMQERISREVKLYVGRAEMQLTLV